MTKTNIQKQFEAAMDHLNIMADKSVVRVEDVNYLLNAAEKLLLQFEEIGRSRAKWRLRAEDAESKLKNA